MVMMAEAEEIVMASQTSASDVVDGSHRRHLGAKVWCRLMDRECPLLAISGRFEGSARESALHPKADIQAAIPRQPLSNGHCHVNRFDSEIAVNCRWSPYAFSMT
jgi:hypothetical protein